MRLSLRWTFGVLLLSVFVWAVFVRTNTPVDLYVFLSAGHAVSTEHNPYPVLGTPDVWSGSAFVYPWLTAWLFAFASLVSTHAAALLMLVVSVACVAFGVRAIAGPRIGPTACVLLSSPTLDGLQLGTLNAVLFLGVCLAWRWRDRPLHAGITLGVLVMLKIFCWPLTLWLLLTRRWRAAGVAVATAAALLGAGWVFGPVGLVPYGQMLSQLSLHEAANGSGLQGMLIRLAITPSAAQIVALGLAAAMLALVSRRGDGAVYAASIVSALLITPVVWHHYYLLIAAPLLLVRHGARWYLLVGWASTAARAAEGISWVWLTVAANVVLVLLTGWWLWRRRREVLLLVQRMLQIGRAHV